MIAISTENEAGVFTNYNFLAGKFGQYSLKEFDKDEDAQLWVWNSYTTEFRFIIGWESITDIPINRTRDFSDSEDARIFMKEHKYFVRA